MKTKLIFVILTMVWLIVSSAVLALETTPPDRRHPSVESTAVGVDSTETDTLAPTPANQRGPGQRHQYRWRGRKMDRFVDRDGDGICDGRSITGKFRVLGRARWRTAAPDSTSRDSLK